MGDNIQYKCIKRFKNTQGIIEGYRIIDSYGEIRDIKSQDLKNMMILDGFRVVNLKLTSDNRIFSINIKNDNFEVNRVYILKSEAIAKINEIATEKLSWTFKPVGNIKFSLIKSKVAMINNLTIINDSVLVLKYQENKTLIVIINADKV